IHTTTHGSVSAPEGREQPTHLRLRASRKFHLDYSSKVGRGLATTALGIAVAQGQGSDGPDPGLVLESIKTSERVGSGNVGFQTPSVFHLFPSRIHSGVVLNRWSWREIKNVRESA